MTLAVAIVSAALATLAGIGAGALAATRPYSRFDLDQTLRTWRLLECAMVVE
jgi:ABC-type dipeptide/oligopeptide/nickel transport system permease component